MTPDRFARLCAVIGYAQSQTVDALVVGYGLQRPDAETRTEAQYAKYAAEEAEEAAKLHIHNV